jgi:hypothetical protein
MIKYYFLDFGGACVLQKKDIFHDLRSLLYFPSDLINFFQIKNPHLEKLAKIIDFHNLRLPQTCDTLIGPHIFDYSHNQIKDIIINTIKNLTDNYTEINIWGSN